MDWIKIGDYFIPADKILYIAADENYLQLPTILVRMTMYEENLIIGFDTKKDRDDELSDLWMRL